MLPRGRVWLDVGHTAAVGAVDTTCAGGVGYIENGMIEDVEGLELELTFDAFLDRNVLQDGSVRHVLTGTGEGVAADVAEGSKGGATEWARPSADRSRRGCEVLDRMCDGVKSARFECEGSTSFVGAAIAAAAGPVEVVIEVLIETALGVGRCETRTTLPSGSTTNAVASDEIVHETTAV